MSRCGRLNEREVIQAFDISQKIPVTLVPVKIDEALRIALRFKIHAYDAYYLQCCMERGLPLISLDYRMCSVARSLGIGMVE